MWRAAYAARQTFTILSQVQVPLSQAQLSQAQVPLSQAQVKTPIMCPEVHENGSFIELGSGYPRSKTWLEVASAQEEVVLPLSNATEERGLALPAATRLLAQTDPMMRKSPENFDSASEGEVLHSECKRRNGLAPRPTLTELLFRPEHQIPARNPRDSDRLRRHASLQSARSLWSAALAFSPRVGRLTNIHRNCPASLFLTCSYAQPHWCSYALLPNLPQTQFSRITESRYLVE